MTDAKRMRHDEAETATRAARRTEFGFGDNGSPQEAGRSLSLNSMDVGITSGHSESGVYPGILPYAAQHSGYDHRHSGCLIVSEPTLAILKEI